MSEDESDWESDFDSSDDENWSDISSGDSDAELHRSAKPTRRRDKVKTGLVSDDGYQRFDTLGSEEEDSWRLPADLASYLKWQAGKELDKGHKKALKQEAPAPKERALQPPMKLTMILWTCWNQMPKNKTNRRTGNYHLCMNLLQP